MTNEVGPLPAASTDDPMTLKILMLHGFTQSGPLFHAKTRALEKALHKALAPPSQPGQLPGPQGGLQLIYATAPVKLRPADSPDFFASSQRAASSRSSGPAVPDADPDGPLDPDAWGWWRKDDASGEYRDLDTGLATLAHVLETQGPFVGVIGFSQGAAAAAMLASLLEPARLHAFTAYRASSNSVGMPYPPAFLTRNGPDESGPDRVIHPPLKFAVSYCGFAAPHPRYSAFYDPPISTPFLHFMGSLDTVVDESRTLRLVEACSIPDDMRSRRVINYPGGHFLPTQRVYLDLVIQFIRDTTADRTVC
ncbi:MAG: hypothetical protein M1817_003846 [Caeruleum heppii]|nr:MAG: hypothetical protein M1817_003846 [Caeruleum heppii]